MTTTTTYKGRTAEEWREAARASRQASYESFQRSDTDGFLSQWASDLSAREYELCADLAENGATIEVTALFDAETGEVASTHNAQGRFGWYWVLNDAAAAKAGKRFVNESKAQAAEKRAAAMRKKGFTVGLVKVAAEVGIAASGTGLSGAATARAVIRPVVEALREGRYEVVTTALADDDVRW